MLTRYALFLSMIFIGVPMSARAQNSAADADMMKTSALLRGCLEDQPVISMASKKCIGCSNCLINVVWTSSTSGGRRRAHSCERSSDL